MKTAIVVILFICLLPLAAPPAFANDSTLIASDDPSLLWIEWGLILNEEAPVTSVYPVTGRELEARGVLEDDPPAGAAVTDFSLTLLPAVGAFSLPPAITLGRNGETLNPAGTWLYWSLPPYASVGADLEVSDWLHLRVCYDQRFDAGQMAGKSGDLAGAYLFESSLPREGYLSLSVDHFEAVVGRTQAGIGFGYFGNLFLNGHANYYDRVAFAAYSDHFKYFYMFGSSDPLLTPTEQRIQNSAWEFPSFNAPHKTYVYKRLEFRPWKRLLLGAGEASVMGGVAPDLSNLNPFNMWHNTYAYGYQNSLFVLDASLVPVKGLHLFGEFIIDDILLKREAGSRMPTALGWQAGAQFVFQVGKDFRAQAGVEYTHVDPWTYNAFQPYLMYYQRQSYASIVNDSYMDIPLGYTFGSDLDHYGAYFRLISKGGALTDVSYFHMIQGEPILGPYDDSQSWYNMNDRLPVVNGHVGVTEIYDCVGIRLQYPLGPSFSVIASGNYAFIRNFGHEPGATGRMYTVLVGLQYRL